MRRRRACTSCGRRFTTYERVQADVPLVRKRNGQRQRFDRNKLRGSLLRATHKRDVAKGEVDALVARVERAAADAGGEISAAQVSELCLDGLRELDWGAYLQFAGTLPAPSPEFAGAGGGGRRAGSVRVAREDPESTPKAASRRGLDE